MTQQDAFGQQVDAGESRAHKAALRASLERRHKADTILRALRDAGVEIFVGQDRVSFVLPAVGHELVEQYSFDKITKKELPYG